MAHDTTVLNGDVGVWWFGNNRGKMLTWLGAASDFYSMNELYSAVYNLQDEPTTVDDGTCFNADTPVEYTIGKIDVGDNEPWYVSYELMEHITGGALRTDGWLRVQDSNTGIIMVEVASASNSISNSDIGFDIVHTDGDTGTLLEALVDSGTSDYLMIRPDSSAIGNSFDNTTGTLTCNVQTATSITAIGTSGEQIWPNIYSISTLDPNVHIYLYQGARLTTDASTRQYSWMDNTIDWYDNGHIDTTIPIKDMTQGPWAVIDGGYVRAFAHKPGDEFASAEVSNSIISGGRNPIPLQTKEDRNQSHGIKKISTGSWTGTFVNREILTGGTNGGRAILDLVNSTVDTELVYFPIAKDEPGGTIEPFINTEVISGAAANATAGGAEADDGAADSGWFTGSGAPTIAFGFDNEDIDNDGTDENYGYTVDCNQCPLSEVFQWMKFIGGNGQGAGGVIETAESGVEGEEYEGATAYFHYSAISGTIAEGESVTQATSGATGVILSHDLTADVVILRSTRGEFDDTNQIDADDDADYFTPDAAANFAFVAISPLGTFAGGVMSVARGGLLRDYKSADENLFELTDVEGTPRERPTSIVLEQTNVHGNALTEDDADLCCFYRLTGSGGNVEKDTMTCDGSEVAGDTTLDVDDIPVDTPTLGRVALVDVTDGNKEYLMRYSAWDSGTDQFTLANIDVANADAATTTTITESGAFGSADRGDLVYNHDVGLPDGLSYVVSVDSANQITIYPAIPGQDAGDHIELNCVPLTVTSSDEAYVPFMHRYATTTPEQVSVIYPGSQVFLRATCRNTRETDLVNGPIKNFSQNTSTSGSNASVQVTRTIDKIKT